MDTIKGPYDNVLVKSSETVEQDISVTVTVPSGLDTTGLKEIAEAGIMQYMQIGKQRVLYELYNIRPCLCSQGCDQGDVPIQKISG